MRTHPNICESCRTRPVEILENFDEEIQPYRLCTQCHYRLINVALRPSEFFNLTAIHGHAHHLHDDFYDDTGEATQPKIDIQEPESFPFPDLQAIKTDLEWMVDFACVQYFTSNEVIEVLKGFDKQVVLEYLTFKVEYNRSINYKAYEIAAKVLGSYGADWIRQQWSRRKENEFSMFTPALAACLPFDEGYSLVTKEIEQLPDNLLANNSYALIYFRSNKTLEWIEKIKGRINNVSSAWGSVTAASKFDWQTAEKWLDAGRPLSLIALDALVYCTTTGERRNQSIWMREHAPTLLNAPKPEIIANTLTAYLHSDSVPRTKSAVSQIINNLFPTTSE